MSSAAPITETGLDRPILFFDGVCGLCNRAVDFVLARDREGAFLFAPLQGETGQRLLSARDVESLDTLVLLTPQGAYRRSAAVVRILWELRPLWQAAGWKEVAGWIAEDIAAGRTMSNAPLPKWVLERDGVHSVQGAFAPSANAVPSPGGVEPCG